MLTKLDPNQIEYIYNTFMVYDFPPNELKPLPHLLRMVEKGLCTYYALYEDGKVLSYFGLCVKNGWALVDYLAVNPKLRGNGIGTETLKHLKKVAGENTIIIECEAVNNAIDTDEAQNRRRRITFYTRSGFKLTDVKATLFGVDYVLLHFPNRECDVKLGYQMVYRAMLGDEMYNKNMQM